MKTRKSPSIAAALLLPLLFSALLTSSLHAFGVLTSYSTQAGMDYVYYIADNPEVQNTPNVYVLERNVKSSDGPYACLSVTLNAQPNGVPPYGELTGFSAKPNSWPVEQDYVFYADAVDNADVWDLQGGPSVEWEGGDSPLTWDVTSPDLLAWRGKLTSLFDGSSGHVFYVAETGDIMALDSEPSLGLPWTPANLTASARAPGYDLSDLTGRITSFWDYTDGTEHVFYTDNNHHVRELYHNAGGWWTNDLMGPANPANATVPPPTDDQLTSDFDGRSEHVFFVGADYHMHELYFDTENTAKGWRNRDLTKLAILDGTNTAAASVWALPACMFDSSSGHNHIFYRGQDNHIHQFYSDSSGNWYAQDLTKESTNKSQPPYFGTTISCDFSTLNANQRVQEIYYVGQDEQIYRLTYYYPTSGSGSWQTDAVMPPGAAPADVTMY